MSKTLQDFVTEYGLQDDLVSWLDGRINDLTEQVFLDSLKGKNGKSGLTDPYEKFWINVFSVYVKPQSEDSIPTEILT